jgi:hypothetical protein
MPFGVFGNGLSGRPLASGVYQLVSRLSGIRPYREGLPAMGLEVHRARRYERPLSMLAIGVAGVNMPEREALADFLLLGIVLRDALRETDLVSSAVEFQLYAMLLTETTRPGAVAAADRYSSIAKGSADLRIRWGAAEFPGNGLSVDDLFAHARHARHAHLQVGTIPIVKEASSV